MDKTKRRMVFNILFGLVCVFVVLSFYGTFSLNTDYKFVSDVYSVKDGYIEGISVNTSVDLFKKYFDVSNCSIKVVDRDNNEITHGYVVNGSRTLVYGLNGDVISSYINIIKGDYNGDGIIDDGDFYEMGKCLVDGCSYEDWLLESIDIDDDLVFGINDLTLLDSVISEGVQGISILNESLVLQSNEAGRIVSRVMPGYGVNLNVKWESDDDSIVSVDEAGRVLGHNEGEVLIHATTMGEEYSTSLLVKVDNTIQLDSYEGVGYLNGEGISVFIKSVSYDDLECLVEDEGIASCFIEDNKLNIRFNNVGSTTVYVKSEKYGEVSYNLRVLSVYLNIIPDYVCLTPNSSRLITVSGFNMGNLSFSFGDREVIKDSYLTDYNSRKMLRIDAGGKQGRSILEVSEDNGNTRVSVVVDVASIRMEELGFFVNKDEEASFAVIGDNIGNLTCESTNSNIGTCRIEDNRVIVTPFKVGTFNVYVYNNITYEGYNEKCGEAMFVVVVKE